MRLSQLLLNRNAESDDDLLARAGYTYRVGDGLYSLLPLGNRVLQRINSIVRRELERAGAQEVTMPLLQPRLLWQQRIRGGATRADAFGPQLFQVRGGTGDDWVLAPTHEEIAALLGAACIHAPRDLPRIIFQIQPRFRDHPFTAKTGLLRTREFVMADAYSFHADAASLQETYAAMKRAIANVLLDCGVAAGAVKASSGAMGGDDSEELIAPLPETRVVAAVRCAGCEYAASLEVAEFQRVCPQHREMLPLKEAAVPDGTEADEGLAFLESSLSNRLGCVPFIAGTNLVLAVLPANLVLSCEKLLCALSRANIDVAGFHQGSAEELVRLGGDGDWISLVRTPPAVFVIADESVRTGSNFVFPSQQAGRYLLNLNSSRDFRVDIFADLAVASAGDLCMRCGSRLRAIYGTEVAHLFNLGSSYAAAFGAFPQSCKPPQMGCYGLGITRLMATIVHQNRDEHGIVWPHSVAPYAAIIVPAASDCSCRAFSEHLYHMLSNSVVDVLLDDSDDTLENRLAYADLLGIPVKIIASENLQQTVEVRERRSVESQSIRAENLGALLHKRSG
jgi:prolyl-tRNA synthetase